MKQFQPKIESIDAVKQEKPFDENGVPRELWTQRDELQEWARTKSDIFTTFLDNRNAKFKLVGGMGFYHEPGADKISLSTPEFKAMREGGKMTEEQFVFVGCHEFAHLKTMMELDPAGKYNQLEQFNYERSKKIPSIDNPGKFVSLSSTYRQYYNILEDAMVNHLVLKSAYFASNFTAEGKKRTESIESMYTTKMFSLYEDVVSGDFAQNEKGEIHKVETGTGDLRLLDEVDYEKGIDFTKARPELKNAGEFLTFFIKNQMIGMKPQDVYDEKENPNGKHHLSEAASIVLRKPLAEAYESLLGIVNNKNQAEPEKLERYSRFLKQVHLVNNFALKNGESEKVGSELYDNGVLMTDKEQKSGQIEPCINAAWANAQFGAKIRRVQQSMGIKSFDSLTFIELFDRFKETKAASGYSATRPLKFGLTERTRVMRQVLEPIYTLLCIIDDNFEVKLPPEKEPGEEGEGEDGDSSPENQESPSWKAGDEVKNAKTGQKGVIVNVIPDEATHGVRSVEVRYFDEEQAMASGVGVSTKTEVFFRPDQELILLYDEADDGGQSVSKDDKRKREPKEKKDKKNKDSKEKSKDKDQQDKDLQSKEKEKKERSDGSGESSGENGEDVDLGEAMSDMEKSLRDMMAQDKREKTLKDVEAQLKSPEFQAKQAAERDKDRILKKMSGSGAGSGGYKEDPLEVDAELYDQFKKLENELAPYANKMAETWSDVVRNISQKFEILKDKYYREGKLDAKRLQRHWPEIELGYGFDQKRVYEQFIEKIVAELRPKLLRVNLLVDLSGSMSGNIDAVRMAVMLINSSLRSFRVLFKNELERIIGPAAAKEDVLTDLQILGFESSTHQVKRFDIEDLSFLEKAEGTAPTQDADYETISTIRSFKKIKAMGGTQDDDCWQILEAQHQDEIIQRLLKDQKMTEMIFQISDGEIDGYEAAEIAEKLRRMNVGVGGMAIGSDGAKKSLEDRLGVGNVISANTPQEIVDQFSTLLVKMVKEKIEDVMTENLKQYE